MAPPRPLLLLSEDHALADLLAPLVEAEGGYSLTCAKPGEAWIVAAAQPWAAALADGAASLALLAASGLTVPFILLGGETLPPGVAAALRKPVRVAELMAALARHAAAAPAAGVALGAALRLDPAARVLARTGLGEGAARVRLTEKEAAILLHLHAAGRPVPKEELLGEVWGYSPEATTHTLETHVYRLRRKLVAAFGQAVVVTERGGYRLAP